MDYQNNDQYTGPRFCPNCGNPIASDEQFCSNCGYNLGGISANPVNVEPAPVFTPADSDAAQPQNTYEQNIDATSAASVFSYNTPEQEYGAVNPAPVPPQNIPVEPYAQPASPNQPYNQSTMPNPPYPQGAPNPPQKKKSKKLLLILIPVILVLFLFFGIVIFGILVATHTICLDHEYTAASCTKAATCIYCDKTDGVAKGHDWSEASCTEDQVCEVCGEIGELATGHTRGEWTVTNEATLRYTGKEEVRCTTCDKLLDERTISKKKPAVVGSSFNFKDEEFIGYVNSIANLTIGSQMDTKLGEEYTSYSLKVYDGSVGAIIFKHDATGNICEIITMFEESPPAVAMVVYFASLMDSRFSTDTAIERLFQYSGYTASGMTLVMTDGDDGYYLAMVAPSSNSSDTL